MSKRDIAGSIEDGARDLIDEDGSARLESNGRKKLYQKLSRTNGMPALLFQCMGQGELVLITLKARHIYTGMVHASW